VLDSKAPNNCFQKNEEKLPKFILNFYNKWLTGNVPVSHFKRGKNEEIIRLLIDKANTLPTINNKLSILIHI
jgi:hypothetical protein